MESAARIISTLFGQGRRAGRARWYLHTPPARFEVFVEYNLGGTFHLLTWSTWVPIKPRWSKVDDMVRRGEMEHWHQCEDIRRGSHSEPFLK